MKKRKVKKRIVKKAELLIVDDEKSLRDSLTLLLKDDYDLHQAKNGKEAISLIKHNPIDLVLLDVRLPEIDGLEILKIIKGIDSSIEVIMLTAIIMVKHAVEAIRAGAYDYITKPFDVDTLISQITKALEKRRLNQENINLRKIIEQDCQFEKIIGRSKEIREIFKTIDDVANSNASVMITGESGTGKELVARAIHNRSPRKTKLFVAINCAAIPEHLLESELFGHERGSFTGAHDRQLGKFELANGGTLFLDEIGSLPMPMQAKLLRALQQKEIERLGAGYPVAIDARLITATNANLREAIKKYKFREDLFYRLNVVPVHLPALRERKEDIPLLANHFLRKFSQEFGRPAKEFKPGVLTLLEKYDWPGNIRELENLVERLVVLSKTSQIDTLLLPTEIRGSDQLPEPEKHTLFDAVDRFETEFIKKAMNKAGGKKGRTAKLLGIHRNTLIQLERRLGLN